MLLNILLLIGGLFFLIPKDTWKKPLNKHTETLQAQIFSLGLIIIVAVVHLLEVNILDSFATSLINANFTPVIQAIEDGGVHWFTQFWTPGLVYFFVFIYLGLYPFLLWFTLLYFILTAQNKPMKTFAYSLAGIYAIALPFYLFVPITNVYHYYGTTSALNMVIPSVEHFFYTTTTSNNCFPSLHVAMSLLLILTVARTHNKRFLYLTYFCAICVTGAVIYLAIHWITDVIGGALLAIGVFSLVTHFLKEP